MNWEGFAFFLLTAEREQIRRKTDESVALNIFSLHHSAIL